jgi:hypothetical protein
MQTLFRNLTPLIFALLVVSGGNCQEFVSSDLPIIIINTQGQTIVDDPKIVVDMGVIYHGEGQRNYLGDAWNNYDGKAAIEIRGSSSQMFPKKQYGIELRDDSGLVDLDTTLLGFPPESDWILFAPYNDKSLMRDVLAYDLAQDLGRYAPRAKYCELVLNGQYEGIYVLLEKVKRDRHRVDIADIDPEDVAGDELTGGYIIKIDKQTGSYDQGWLSDFPPVPNVGSQRINFLYHDPGPYEINTYQKSYIQGVIANFEGALMSENFKDPLNGYSRFIDVGSFVDFFIINEISKNVDGYRLSTYLHKQRNSDGGKLVMGPVWDFNLGFGNADYCTSGGPDGLVLNFNSICRNDWWLIPFWWNRLFEDPAFSKKVQQRWNELRSDTFSTERILDRVDSIQSLLSESQVRNFQRWPVLGEYVWPNYYVGPTYESEVDWLKLWIGQRLAWLDDYIAGIVTGTENRGGEPFFLHGVYPNPSISGFNFKFSVAVPSDVEVEIFDLRGRKTACEPRRLFESGDHTIKLGADLQAGTYFYRLRTNSRFAAFGKLVKN